MRTKAILPDSLSAILHLLTPENRLVCLVALNTGLRVSDVLDIKTEDIRKTRFVIRERKTGKRKVVRIPEKIRTEIIKYSGKVYAFPGRLNNDKPRTREAVWKDLNKVSKLLHLKGVAPHSMRKTYARELRRQGFSEAAVQRALNHSSPTVTRLYTMADEVSLR